MSIAKGQHDYVILLPLEPGKVVKIRPFGEKKRGDMTYIIYIEPDHYDDRLK